MNALRDNAGVEKEKVSPRSLDPELKNDENRQAGRQKENKTKDSKRTR